MAATDEQLSSAGPANSIGRNAPAALAAAAAMAMVLCLTIRPLSSPDIGYHLAYGEVFWNSGRIVDDAIGVYPPPTRLTSRADDLPLPPGCYYDSQGTYRFANDKWLTQAIFAGVHNQFGWGGLHALRIALVLGILGLQAGLLIRLGVSPAWLGPIWLATGLAACERLTLRPELPGYVCIMLHLWLLSGTITRRRVAAIILVQIAAVNVHGFWMLNVGIVLAFTADAAAVAAWRRWRLRVRPIEKPLRSRLVRLAVCSALLAPAVMVSPGGWRTAVLPAQTLLMLHEHKIAGSSQKQVAQRWRDPNSHPWEMIGEFSSPFAPVFSKTSATMVYILLLALAGPAGIVLLWRRRWAWTAILAAYVAISLNMRRNIAAMAITASPIIALAAHTLLTGRRCKPNRHPKPSGPGRSGASGSPVWRVAKAAALLCTAVFSTWLTYQIVTNRFYVNERREWRFGTGVSRLSIPLGACEWLDANLQRAQPAFTDTNTSSNVVYFCEKVTAAPLLTNTWAAPPSRMKRLLNFCAYGFDGDNPLNEWGMDVVVLQVWPHTTGLARQLVASPGWALVHAETWFLVFLRRTEQNREIIAANEITRKNFDTERFARLCRAADPAPAFGLKAGAGAIHALGWWEHSGRLWRMCLKLDDSFHEAWSNLGVCLATQGERLLAAGDSRGAAMLREAVTCFEKALSLRKNYPAARTNADRAGRRLRQYERTGY